MTEWWEFTRVVIIPLIFGSFAFTAGAYVMSWLVQRSVNKSLTKVADAAREGRSALWEGIAAMKENELRHLEGRVEQLEREKKAG